MNRRFLLASCMLAPIVGCSGDIVLSKVQNTVSDLTDALLDRAAPDLRTEITTLRDAVLGGGNWKAAIRALLPVLSRVIDSPISPLPAGYAITAKAILATLGALIGLAGSAPAGVPILSLDQAEAAARAMRRGR